jgi:hypothetical protein
MVEVMQADRDAACLFNKERRSWYQIEAAQDRAARDTVELAQAFARHRMLGREAGLREAAALIEHRNPNEGNYILDSRNGIG